MLPKSAKLGLIMMRQILRALLLVLAFVAVPAFGRDWKECPAVVSLQTGEMVTSPRIAVWGSSAYVRYDNVA